MSDDKCLLKELQSVKLSNFEEFKLRLKAVLGNTITLPTLVADHDRLVHYRNNELEWE